MLWCLVILLFAVASRSLGRNCISNYIDAERMILNGTLSGVLANISTAFFPTADKEAEYLAIRYYYALNCNDGGLNHSLETDYTWASSSVYLVVEPNALKDLTCGIVDVAQGSLFINLQCLCPTYPDDVTSILRRLTAYLRCYARINIKPLSDDDHECKINSFIRRYDSDDSLYEKVVDVMNTIKVVSWLSLILMLFLQLQLLNTLYTVVLMNHSKYMNRKRSESLMKQKEINKKSTTELTHYFSIAWATIYIAIVVLVLILIRDANSELVDCDSSNNHDYKELYIGVYSTWLVGIVIAIYFPKHISFPVPVVTALYERWNMMESRLFHVLTFTIQSLAIWILFCLIQLLTLHGIFLLVAVLAKPVAVLVTLSFVSTLIGSAISGTSVMLEVISLERINPCRSTSRKAVNFQLYNYLKDLPSLIGSALLAIFLLSLMFLVYQFGDKLGSTLNFTGVPAAIAGTVQSVFFFLVSVALRKKSFRDLFEKRDYEEEEEQKNRKEPNPQEEIKPHVEPKDREGSKDGYTVILSNEGPAAVHRFRFDNQKWPHKFLHTNHLDDIDDNDDDDTNNVDDNYTINSK